MKRGGHAGHTHTWTILCNGRCYVRSISARCSTGLFRVEVNRSAVPTVRRASRSTCDNSAQTHYSRPEVLWLPSHLYRKATLTPTHTRDTHTRTHTHATQTPLFSLLTANLSKRGAVGGGGLGARTPWLSEQTDRSAVSLYNLGNVWLPTDVFSLTKA